jgi:hypothetical protein
MRVVSGERGVNLARLRFLTYQATDTNDKAVLMFNQIRGKGRALQVAGNLE